MEAVHRKIQDLFTAKELGDVVSEITSVSGGFMHRMYKVETASGVYAVKHLNREILKRPGVLDNYAKSERLEAVLERSGIDIVPAITIGGKKMQEQDGEYFYIFHWQNGSITDWDNITPEQCYLAGEIQAKIHAIEERKIPHEEPELSDINWDEFIAKAEEQGSEIARLLKENAELLFYAQDALNEGRRNLPDIETIVDEDMDPKNVMWDDGKPYVIDLECLDYGNPASSVLQLALQWSGITTMTLDYEKVKAFFEGYRESGTSAFRAYKDIFGVAYTWIEWLEFNISRALGECLDEEDRKMGISEVRNTIARIRYIYEREDEIKRQIDAIFE